MIFPRPKQFRLLVFVMLVFSVPPILAFGDEWRPITPAELQMKTPKVEADADAEAIFWEIRIDDSRSDELSMVHYVRVKIFTERGRERFSKIDIPFVKGRVKIKEIAARIVRPDGSIVDVAEKDVIEREIIRANRVKIRAKSFAVPSIEAGVIVEYRYREIIEDGGAAGMDLEFQKDIPVQQLSYYYKPYNKKDPLFQLYNFEGTRFIKQDKGFYLAERTNVPAFKEEPRMPPEDMVRHWMELQGVRVNVTDVSAMSITFSIKDPSNPTQYWGSVAGEKAGLIEFMNKPDKEIRRVAMEVTSNASSPDEKLKLLYDFCQKQIKNASFDTTIPEADKTKGNKVKSVADVLKVRVADSPYVDMLFGSMASSIGFDTRVAFLGNRSEMFFDPRMTSESLVHPGAIAVKVGNDWKFFNPGLPFLSYGMLVWYEEDVWALLVGARQHSWAKTPLTGHEQSLTKRTGKFKLSEDGTLEGDVAIELNGQAAVVDRLDLYDKDAAARDQEVQDDFKRRVATGEITAVSIENLNDISKPLVYRYKVRVPGYAQKTGKRIFFQPGFFEYGVGPTFSSPTRKYDIYFHYPWAEKDEVEIMLPAGYALDGADQPGEVSDPSNIASLKISIGTDREMTFMKYTRQFHFGGGGNILFPVSVYPNLKSLFDEFNKRDAHTIGLKQKQ